MADYRVRTSRPSFRTSAGVLTPAWKEFKDGELTPGQIEALEKEQLVEIQEMKPVAVEISEAKQGKS